MPKPPTPSTRTISNSPKRVPGGSASWSAPTAGADRGAESGGSVLIGRGPARRRAKERSLPQGADDSPPSVGGGSGSVENTRFSTPPTSRHGHHPAASSPRP